MVVMSLDISPACTGAVIYSKPDGLVYFHKIKTSAKNSRGARLASFREQLIEVMDYYNVTDVVVEDAFSGINVRTLKMLAEFSGVAKEVIYDYLDMEPYVISNNTVKSYFKVRNKEDLFVVVASLLPKKPLTFKHDNDITDAYAQLLCYLDKVLGQYKFRFESDGEVTFKGFDNYEC